MIQLYHGDGKGKTTAAVGAAIRAAGRRRTVIFAQFMKGRESGELSVLRQLEQIRVLRCDQAFPFFRDMSDQEKAELSVIHNRILEEVLMGLREEGANFVVLDEITHACRLALADHTLLEQILDCGRSPDKEILLTGRKPTERLLEVSDYITEMLCIRHPFESGVPARHGVEL
jgi:cob(I)alamin adenosyltransferase